MEDGIASLHYSKNHSWQIGEIGYIILVVGLRQFWKVDYENTRRLFGDYSRIVGNT